MTPDRYQEYLSKHFDVCDVSCAPDGEIESATLVARSSGHVVPVQRGIPRFVQDEGYAKAFGLQWNVFRTTQLDSKSNLSLSADRLFSGTRWTKSALRQARVLEVGSGAGRFTEVLLAAGAKVVSVDRSTAVDANLLNNRRKGDLLLLQADIFDLPLDDDFFDFVFCYGVLQHTPDPDAAFRAMYRKVRPGGRIAIDYYRRFSCPTPWSTPKYLWRPLTRRLPPRLLLRLVRAYVPVWLPIDTMLKRLLARVPYGFALSGLIPVPCWNYLDSGLNEEQRRTWAILDTFDALSARFDSPRSLSEVREMVEAVGAEDVEVFFGSNGIAANATKPRGARVGPQPQQEAEQPND